MQEKKAILNRFLIMKKTEFQFRSQSTPHAHTLCNQNLHLL